MQQPVYITRPERIIWPVIVFVAATLFSAATEATVDRVRLALARRAPVTATMYAGAADDADVEYRVPGDIPPGELKAADRPRIVGRQGQARVATDLRVTVRRVGVMARLRSTVEEADVLEVKSHRQLVFSPRPGGLVRYFPTAPPQA